MRDARAAEEMGTEGTEEALVGGFLVGRLDADAEAEPFGGAALAGADCAAGGVEAGAPLSPTTLLLLPARVLRVARVARDDLVDASASASAAVPASEEEGGAGSGDLSSASEDATSRSRSRYSPGTSRVARRLLPFDVDVEPGVTRDARPLLRTGSGPGAGAGTGELDPERELPEPESALIVRVLLSDVAAAAARRLAPRGACSSEPRGTRMAPPERLGAGPAPLPMGVTLDRAGRVKGVGAT